MISIVSIISMCITLAVTLVLPLGLFVLYGWKKNRNDVWLAGVLGAVGFVLMQINIRLPLLNSAATCPEFMNWIEEN